MKLLLAEDEKEMQFALVKVFERQGYEVDSAYDGEKALQLAKSGTYDCMIFDIMMPKMDGLEVLRRIREDGNVTPVLMLTAKAEVDDRITGLDAGADDYLTKPFAIRELLARVRSLTRRNTFYTPQELSVGNVTLHIGSQELAAENTIRLANKETKLMELLMLNSGKKVTTQVAFERVWGDDADADPEVVWLYISYLRQKLESVEANVEIKGEKDKSYCLCVKAQEMAEA